MRFNKSSLKNKDRGRLSVSSQGVESDARRKLEDSIEAALKTRIKTLATQDYLDTQKCKISFEIDAAGVRNIVPHRGSG